MKSQKILRSSAKILCWLCSLLEKSTKTMLLALFTLLLPITIHSTARGPPRSYLNNRLNKEHIVIGGHDIIDQAIRTAETQERLEQAANKGEEFVFHSKKEVDAVFKCTACYMSMSYLNSQIVGRMEIKHSSSKPNHQQHRNTIRTNIRSIVSKTCETSSSISKDEPVRAACIGFIQDNIEDLVNILLVRTDPTDDLFESDLKGAICRDVNELDGCGPGVPSMANLLQNRFKEDDQAKVIAEEKEKLQKKEETEAKKRKKKRKKKGKKKVVRRKRRVPSEL